MFVASRFDLAAIAGPIHGQYLPGPTSAFPTFASPEDSAREGLTSASPGRLLPLQVSARETQRLEPILFPKLRIYFADFPYLHCSINQRLLTLGRPAAVMSTTGHENHCLPQIFKGRRERTGHHKKCGALPGIKPYLRTIRFQGESLLKRKENSFRGSRRRLRVRLRCRTCCTRMNSNIRVPVREY